MRSQRVVVVDGSRLVCDLLRRVIEKTPEFEVVEEVKDWGKLPAIINRVEADWLFVVIPPGKEMPEKLTYDLLLARPTLRIIGFWMDGSHIKTEWLGREERNYSGSSFSQLTALLEKELWTNRLTANGSIPDKET